MKKVLMFLVLVLTCSVTHAQYIENYEPEPNISIVKLGLGFGIDYGWLGARLTIMPVSTFGAFIAVGYNGIKSGVNGGVTYKIDLKKKITPVLGLMYGNNAIIIVQGASDYNKAYYGTTISGGIELNMRKSGNYWSFELLYPFRSSEYEDDWDAIRNNPSFEIESDPLPITISVGYHFNI